MYSTKRKFHNLLNSLTSTTQRTDADSIQAKNASSTTLPADLRSQAKRRRTTQPNAPLVSSRIRPKSVHEVSTLRSKDFRTSTRLQPPSEQHKVLNYAPWDRGQFLERLKTFRHVDRWGAKPAQINEVQWAKRGWSCVGKERVRCVGGCGREVYIKLGENSEVSNGEDGGAASWDTGAEEALADRYAKMITSEHGIDCPWKKRGCDDTIHRLPLSHPQTSITALQSRYMSLIAMASELPSKILLPDDVELSIVVDSLPEDFVCSSASEADGTDEASRPGNVNADALALAIVGWEAEPGHIKGLVTCNACFRRLGLWLFPKNLSSAGPAETVGSEEEASAMASLDVASEHRDYCPWVNSISQHGARTSIATRDDREDDPGWKILVRVLKTAHQLRVRAAALAPVLVLEEQSDTTTPTTTANTTVTTNDELSNPRDSADAATGDEASSLREQKDKERWARLKKLKKILNVRSHRNLREQNRKHKPTS